MFCPKCATQNVEGASFCRSCGANISLLPQALSGQLPVAPEPYLDRMSRRRRKRYEEDVPASFEKGIVNVFMGIGFLVAALAVMFKFPGGFTWGWAFFIPAFSCFGRGVAMIVAARKRQPQLPGTSLNSDSLPARGSRATPLPGETYSRPTNELISSVPSVTEGTTRHLGVEAPTRHFESPEEPRRSEN
ncbi:MAG: hypothetical protein DMF71_06705 [Acidobacteria bacterium]|nr:MAG: hypothetical protein DMF71_06705 [Acidobacteriota bacterium]